MLNKLYIVLVFAITCLLVGCRKYGGDNERIVEIAVISRHLGIYCDTTTDMAYLFYVATRTAAVTPYLNADGNPSRCNEVRR